MPGHRPLPRLAQATLGTADRSGFPSLAAVAERAAALMKAPDHVTRARRAASIVLGNVPLLFAVIALAVGLPAAIRLLQTEFLTMGKALVSIRTLEGKADEASVKKWEALEAFVADRFGAELAAEDTWRAVVAWSPILLLWAYVWARSLGGLDVLDVIRNWGVPAAAAVVATAGCVWAVLHPGRGLPDRLTGTYLVPR